MLVQHVSLSVLVVFACDIFSTVVFNIQCLTDLQNALVDVRADNQICFDICFLSHMCCM